MRRNHPGDCPWNRGQIELLKRLWLGGHSAREIGRHIGVSRSSVLGKLSRLGMLRNDSRPKLPPLRQAQGRLPRISGGCSVSRGEQAIEQGKPKRREPRHSLPFPPTLPPPPSPPEPPIGSFYLLDLKAGHCRWPGPEERPPYTFCGAPRAGESSYCEEHYRRAHSAHPLRPINPGYFKLGRGAA